MQDKDSDKALKRLLLVNLLLDLPIIGPGIRLLIGFAFVMFLIFVLFVFHH
jgi:hypothetical protein